MKGLEELGGSLENRLRPYRGKMATFARLLLLATFIEDGFRLIFQWELQTRYLTQLQYGHFLSRLIIVVSILIQLGASALIVAKKFVDPALYSLGSFIVLQMLVYWKVLDFVFFIRNISLLGGLLLLGTFFKVEKDRSRGHSALFDLSDRKYENYMQLAGRLLLIFLTVSVIYGPITPVRVVAGILGAGLCLMVVVGFKTTFSAFMLVIFLAFANLFAHSFWTLDDHHPERDFQKYYFFQTTSVVGGLLLVVYLGPGKFSLDEKNKDL